MIDIANAESINDVRRLAILSRLRECLGSRVQTDPDIVEAYRRDRAMFAEAGRPLAVVRAASTDDVVQVQRLASEFGVPVVPQGARSGLSGGANAVDGCLVVSLENMRAVREIDVLNQIAVVQPGVLNADFSRAVAEHGLFYPPDPSSSGFCTLGGNVATNAGGLCCVKYGVTRDYVIGLEVVLASGEVLRTGRRTAKGVAGLDLVGLFVGSEGTLGIITEITVGLRQAPSSPRTVAATFDTTEAAAAGVSAILESGSVPSLLEFMDRTSILAVNQVLGLGIDERCAAMVIAQTDVSANAQAEIERYGELLSQAGAADVIVADDEMEATLLLRARREAVTALETLGATLVDDVCVPRTELAALVAAVEEIAIAHRTTVGLVGHAGDGNFHPTVVFDRNDPDATTRAHETFEAIMIAALDLGGTITGEHGVGLLKREFLHRELSTVSIEVQAKIKAALDPLNILNPGKVLAR